MSSSNLLKNVISKDINQSQSAIKNLIETADIKGFEELCENSEVIFPFVKEKIIKNFIKLINKNNLETVFKFSKIYSSDFEDLIVKSWLKFADEDLTDRILEFFEKGTNEEKAYCAKYFSYIKDTLAVDYLKEYALSCDFEPLKINCAMALSAFGEIEILNLMKEKILSSAGEFEKIDAYKFLCAYNTPNTVKFILDNALNSPFRVHIIMQLFDFCEFETLVNNFNPDIIFKVFNVFLEGYPEDISLETLEYYRIYDFIEYLLDNKTQYSNNLLAVAKLNFGEYANNENYRFNLDRNAKNELNAIVDLLQDFKPDFSNNSELLKQDDTDYFKSALKVIEEYKLTEFADILGDLINNENTSIQKKAYIAQTLKAINRQDLIQQNAISNIQNDNVKILIESLMV